MLTNKLSGVPFNQFDLESFEVSLLIQEDINSYWFSVHSCLQVFATFCGLGLHNVLTYEKVVIANARQKIAFDVRQWQVNKSMAFNNG